MKVFKYIAVILSIVLLCVYIGFTLVYFSPMFRSVRCSEVTIVIKDGESRSFVSSEDVEELLKRHLVYPSKHKIGEVRMGVIEEVIKSNPMVRTAECYRTASDGIKIEVTQRRPVVRVITPVRSYYIDSDGEEMPTSIKYSAYVPVLSGNISPTYLRSHLMDLVGYISKDKFLNAQIEQIYVDSQLRLELVPRVGSHVVRFGTVDNYEKKCDNLKLFYQKVSNQVGWNFFKSIDLSFENQIICEKRDTLNAVL